MARSVDPPVVHRLIYELRYDLGYTYLDRCGATINAILQKHPGEWFSPEATPQGGILQRVADDLRFTFGCPKLDLSHEQSKTVEKLADIEEFGRVAEEVTDIVAQHLELRDFTRIGFRTWRIFSRRSFEEAKENVVSLGMLPARNVAAIGLANPDEVNWQVVGQQENDVMVRLAVTAVEQNVRIGPEIHKAAREKAYKHPSDERMQVLRESAMARKIIRSYPEFGILVDTDHFMLDPPYPDRLSIAEFIVSSYKSGEEIAERVLALKGAPDVDQAS